MSGKCTLNYRGSAACKAVCSVPRAEPPGPGPVMETRSIETLSDLHGRCLRPTSAMQKTKNMEMCRRQKQTDSLMLLRCVSPRTDPLSREQPSRRKYSARGNLQCSIDRWKPLPLYSSSEGCVVSYEPIFLLKPHISCPKVTRQMPLPLRGGGGGPL